jgi:hypothetical protein
MLNVYTSLAIILLVLYAAGAFPVIITTSIEPALAYEIHKGRLLEVTRRTLWFRKGPVNFIIGSFVQRRPASDGLSTEAKESLIRSDT